MFKEEKDIKSRILSFLVHFGMIFTVAVFFCLVAYILIRGVPNFKLAMFAWKYTSENLSMTPAIINTIHMVCITLLLSVPIGICSAVYLVEYADNKNPIVKLIRITIQTLTAIPSIVFGLFGYIVFVITLRWSFSIIAGALTLAIMVLPTIIKTTEESLLNVQMDYRYGSYALGVNKLNTIIRVVLPAARNGIVGGIILAIGRMVGETAALIYTSGTVAGIAKPTTSGRTLALHMYSLTNEGMKMDEAYAPAVVLLVMVIIINMISRYLVKRRRG